MNTQPDAVQWTIGLLDNVLKQTGMTEKEMCSIVGQPEEWIDKVRNKEVELTLMDCYRLCLHLNLELFQFFKIYNK